MGLPKNYRKNLNITPHKQGYEARQEILNNIANPGTYLPKGILHEDMDRDFIEYVENLINLTLGGKKVPVIFLSIQRWAEFAKTWQFSDVNKNIEHGNIFPSIFSKAINFASWSSDKTIHKKLNHELFDSHAIDSDKDLISMEDNTL